MKRFVELSKLEEERAQEIYRRVIIVDAHQTRKIERIKVEQKTEEYTEFFQAMWETGLTVAVNSPLRGPERRAIDFRMTASYITDLYSMISERHDKVVQTFLEEEEYRAFKEALEKKGLSIQEGLRLAVQKLLESEFKSSTAYISGCLR